MSVSGFVVDRKRWTTKVIYAIGDIHGQRTMLATLLAKLIELPLHIEDTVVFIGDYVDRGENACEVIETLLKWQAQHTNTVFLSSIATRSAWTRARSSADR